MMCSSCSVLDVELMYLQRGRREEGREGELEARVGGEEGGREKRGGREGERGWEGRR